MLLDLGVDWGNPNYQNKYHSESIWHPFPSNNTTPIHSVNFMTRQNPVVPNYAPVANNAPVVIYAACSSIMLL